MNPKYDLIDTSLATAIVSSVMENVVDFFILDILAVYKYTILDILQYTNTQYQAYPQLVLCLA